MSSPQTPPALIQQHSRPAAPANRPYEVLPASRHHGRAQWIEDILRTSEKWPEPSVETTVIDGEGAA